MSPNLARITFLISAMTACHPAIGTAQGKAASWLDEPKPASWNTPGASIPAAPRLAAFAADTQAASTSPSPGLAGTSWQLVKFEGGDDTILTPDDRATYTIEFAADGRLTARIDCNRGRGTWTSSGSSQIRFGPVALRRAQCPPGSLHDQIVKQWENIRSYVIRDRHLFLALMADGGIYEFEPIATPK